MPIYEFKCNICGNVTSKLCRIGDSGTEILCQECGHRGLERQISGFAYSGSQGKNCSAKCSGNCSACM